MSDDDFMFEEEEQDYEFEYEDDGGENGDEDGELGIENKYYNAKAQRDDYEAGMRELQKVADEDRAAGASEWGFRATKQMIKLCLREGKLELVLEHYGRMLEFVRGAVVGRNYAEKSINGMLERVSAGTDAAFSREFYQRTLDVLKETQSDRLWARTSLRLARILLDQRQFGELAPLLDTLRRSCEDAAGNVVMERGTQLLEVNAVYLAMYEAQGDVRRLKDVFVQCEAVRSAVPHPRVMGYIRECGGKIHMDERNWAKAQTCFFEAFKNYDEAGAHQRVEMLKYLVLASMLSESEVNPLASPEAKSYENEPPIRAITSLVRAYERHDVREFERILGCNESAILSDPFISRYIADLRRTFRMQALVQMAAPYTRIRIATLAARISAEPAETEELLVMLILNRRLRGSIDQEAGTLLLRQETADQAQHAALDRWAVAIGGLMQASYQIMS
ncbi:hypothetical protein H4R18_000878 [Coemansia javaensis]|uniref:PCI domain-containing protein n=1 Tax=Coemansia javaensis TaxID=2761396 RepID=A0A9W8HEP4_9FUNG|nr:hypothetical protein H4R18_000878 [Coemansia javaensis]